MNKFVWALQIILALFFIMPAVAKLATPTATLVEKGMLKPTESQLPIRAIGLLELLGCIGIILPMSIRVAPRLTPIAAVGFCLVMAGAFAVHTSKGEYKILPLLVAVFAAAAFVAWYRFKTFKRGYQIA